VKTVGFNNGYVFNATRDHAKWAVTEKSSWTCIGDINRNVSIDVTLYSVLNYIDHAKWEVTEDST
jgi:hypothetical protein